MKVCPVAVWLLFHEGRRDVVFRNFANAPKTRNMNLQNCSQKQFCVALSTRKLQLIRPTYPCASKPVSQFSELRKLEWKFANIFGNMRKGFFTYVTKLSSFYASPK